MSFNIFLQSIYLVRSQFSDALRISAVPYALIVILTLAAFYFAPPPATTGASNAASSWAFFGLSIATTIPFVWMAIGWHRYVLRDERPNAIMPLWRTDRTFAYAGRILQISILMLLIYAGFFLVSFVAVMTSVPILVLFIGSVVLAVAALVVSYRLSPLFPAAALGQPMSLGSAWTATSGSTKTLIGVAILSGIGAVVIDLPIIAFVFMPMGSVLTFVWTTASGWVKLIIGISILTTIYGVFVEKRPLLDL